MSEAWYKPLPDLPGIAILRYLGYTSHRSVRMRQARWKCACGVWGPCGLPLTEALDSARTHAAGCAAGDAAA